MPWMARWAGGFPVYLAEAHGARVVDVDGHEYADLRLGDTGAMARHSPAATVAAVRERLEARGGATVMLPTEDAAWVGAGNALSLAAAKATLESVLTEEAFAHMTALQERFTAGVRETTARHDLPWSIVSLGARAEYRFAATPPRTRTESEAAADVELEDYLHLALLNRGVLITPFHNMALMSPDTTEAEVDRHTAAFAEAVGALVG